jgi:hypothetical protein
LDNLFKPVRDWFASLGWTSVPDEHSIQEAEMHYNDIQNIMSSIPDSFYKASGGYWVLKTKKDFLERAWQRYYNATVHRTNATGDAIELARMADFARSLQEKWEKEKNRVIEKAIEKDAEYRPQPGTTPIAEDQPKPPQDTKYMSYGLIAIIAILVVVLIIVLLRR